MPFVCVCFFLFSSFLVKSLSIVYFVVFTVATICGEQKHARVHCNMSD